MRRWSWLLPASLAALGAGACGAFVDTDDLSRPPSNATDAGPDGTSTAIDAIAEPIPPGPPSLRGVQSAGPIDGDVLTISVPIVVPNDLLLLALWNYNAAATVSGLDDTWQMHTSLDPAGADGNHGSHSLRIYSHVASGAEPTSYTITLATGGTGSVSGILSAWRGVDPRLPVDVERSVEKDFPPLAVPSVDTTAPNAVAVAITSTTYGKGGSWIAPDGMTERSSTGVLGLFEQPWPAPGPTGARSYGSTVQYVTGNGAAIFVLRGLE